MIKSKPCETLDAKLDMTEVMLYEDLLESSKLWRQTELVKGLDKTYRKKKQVKNTTRKLPEVKWISPSRIT